MAEYYVDPSGSDAGTGAVGDPWEHLNYALGQVSTDDTIWMNSGTYDDEAYFNAPAITVDIKSVTGDYRDVIIKPKTLLATYYRWCNINSAATLMKFWDVSFYFDQSNISNWGSNNYMIYGAGGASAGWSAIFTRCHIKAITTTNSAYALYTYSTAKDGWQCYKCVFEDWNVGTGYCIDADDGDITVKDTIFINNYAAIIQPGGSLDNDYNCFYNNSYDVASGAIGANSITSDPDFTTGVEIDETSPCFEAGVTVPGYVETYEGTAPDMGCFEAPVIVIVPDLTGMTLTEASDELIRVNLVLGEVREVFGEITDEPIVQAQNPEAAEEVSPETSVDLVMNKGAREGLSYLYRVF